MGDAKSPPHFYKYFTIIFCAAIFFGCRTNFGTHFYHSSKYSMKPQLLSHYCIYTRDLPKVPNFFSDLKRFRVQEFEAHLNRTRFKLNLLYPLHSLFYVKYSNHITAIDHETDHSIGV